MTHDACPAIRELLLDHVYGALEPEDATRVGAHLAACAACRAALDVARRQQDLLGAAASAEAGDVSFAPPPRERPRILRPLGWIAAAAALLTAVTGVAHVGAERARLVASHPVVEVDGPRTVVAGVPAEFAVTARTADGAPVVGTVVASLADGKGGWNEIARIPMDGRTPGASFPLDPSKLAPGAAALLRVRAEVAGADPVQADLLVREGTRLVSRVTTDKPLYRPGETVRIRALALEGFRLTPAGDVPFRVRVLDPRGGVVLDRQVPSQGGVSGWEHTLAADAAGGTYRVELSGAGDGDAATKVAKSEREFQVRAYRAPRLRFDAELDRASYRPGDRGVAFVSVRRAEGGIPAGAAVEATLRIGDDAAATIPGVVGADGSVSLPFELPSVLSDGAVALSVTVRDGGAVESTAKTVPVVRDTLRFEAFPEGGSLVAGLPNRVYFRARTPEDAAAELDGELRDAAGRVVAPVRTDVLGMGAFEFVPRAGEDYRVVFAATGEPVGEGATLRAEARGATLRASDDAVGANRPLRVAVGSSDGGTYTVGAWCRGIPVGEARVRVAPGGVADASVRLRSSVGGVLRVTVFDAAGVPVAERLVAREVARSLRIDVTPERTKVAPRERVRVAVRVRDEKGAPTMAVLGAAVVDQSVHALARDRASAPLPLHFLLGMEVRDLEEAEVFASGPQAALATDRILGVQGWRRFAWRDPAAFLAEHPEDAPRIGAVTADETPNRWSNADAVASLVGDGVADAKREFRGVSLALGVLGLFLAGVWVGVRGLTAASRGHAVGGFAVCALLAAGVGFAALQSRSDTAVARLFDVAAEGEAELLFGAAAPGAAPVPAGAAGEFLQDGGLAPDTRTPEDDAEEERALAAGEARLLALVVDDAKGPATPDGGAFVGLVEVEELKKVAEADDLLDDERNVAGFRRLERRRLAAFLVREHSHRAAPPTGVRDDFADVLYWHPLLRTDAQGVAALEFDTSDALTAFRIDLEGHDGRGALGAARSEISNRVPFQAEPKLPLALTAGDEVDLPVVLGNDGDVPVDVTVTVAADRPLLTPRAGAAAASPVRVAPGARGRAIVPLVAGPGRGDLLLTVDARAVALADTSRRAVTVHPRGFPVAIARSGVLERVDATTVLLPDRFDRATVRGTLRLYPSVLATLVDGLDGLLAEPGGCFEQASSTNYPNVMVLRYLQEQGAAAPAVARRAKDLLGRGYALLGGYECRRRGFEWFGSDPGHEALTAYGLLEFADMTHVHDVDPAMVARTRDWLMGRRDGNGGFLRDPKALDTFGAAPQETTDAYVVWALTEADRTVDLSKELDLLETRAREGDDAYVLALAANALHNAGRPSAGALIERLASLQRADGGVPGKKLSVTSSTGVNLDVETTALAVLAFAREPSRLANAEAGVRYLLAQRQGGRFGATQATILALRALTAHAKASRRVACDHHVTVLVNGVPVAQRDVAAGAVGTIEVDEVLAALVPGENRVELKTTGAEALPWGLHVELTTDRPASDPACAVGIATSLTKSELREGETLDLRVEVVNRTDEGRPMTIARVGVPAGLEPRAERLAELKRAGAIDFFELRPREVVLYWRGLAPRAERKVAVEVAAVVPGRYEGPASSAYLYYTDDKKTWAEPLRCSVEPAR